jgi:hypothetical protein
MNTNDWIKVLTISVGALLYAGIFIPPIARILRRAGKSQWWALFVPVINIVGLWVFAWARWPSEQTRPLPDSK